MSRPPSKTSCPVRIFLPLLPTSANSDVLSISDIYHIVAKKNLENSSDVIQPLEGRGIDIAKSEDDGGAKQGGKCC